MHAQIAESTEKKASLEGKLHALDKLLASISNQRQQYQLLGDICISLEKLSEMGAADLFWAEQLDSYSPEQKLQRIQAAVAEFQQKISAIDRLRTSLQSGIQDQLNDICRLDSQLVTARKVKDKIRNEYVVERKAREMPYRPVVMPWSKQGEDERRFHNILVIFSLLAIALGATVSLWKLPPPDTDAEAVVPERLAQLIKKKHEKPPEPKALEKKEEKPIDKEEEKIPSKKTETQQAPAEVETKGVLAFKNNLADLMKDSSSGKLGSEVCPRRPIGIAAAV